MTLRERIKNLCRTSLLITFLMGCINGIYNGLRDGFFGRIMTSYSAADTLYRKGMIGKFFSKRGYAAIWIRKIRLRLAEFFENSVLLGVGQKKTTYLLGCSLRVYGICLMTFGAYTILLHYIKNYAFPDLIQTNTALWIGVVSVALAIPMIGSRHSLAELLQKGLIPHLLLVDVCGIPEERFDIPRVKRGGRYNYALLYGMLAGLLTFLIPAQYILVFALLLLVVAVVMSYPEVGVLALILIMPFSVHLSDSIRILDFAIGLTSIAYIGKLIRGKRIIRFSLIDTIVLLFVLTLWFGGVVSMGGEISKQQAGHACMLILIYVMIVNLIRTPAWLHRAVLAAVGAAGLSAVLAIFRYLDALPTTGLLPTISSRLSGNFDEPSMLAAYLLLILPLLTAIYMTTTGVKHRMIAFFCGIAMLAALFFSWSRSAWLGVAVALLFFFLIYSRKSACWILIGGLTVPIWSGFLPDSFLRRLLGIVDMADPTVYERVYTWRGAMRMLKDHILGGIGYGSSAFVRVYPQYSVSGLEQADHIDSLYLTLWSAVGLLGLLVFAIMIVVFVQHCFEYVGNAPETYSRTFVAAGLSSIVGALVMGIGSDIWQNETVLMTFFTVFALTCAYIRAGMLIRARNQDVSGTDVSHAHLDLYFED